MDGPVGWIVWAATATTAGCVLATWVHATEPGRGHHRRAERLMGASAALLAVGAVWFAHIGGRAGHQAITSPAAPAWLLQVGKLWATPQAALLLLASIAAAALWWTARRWRQKRLAAGQPAVDALHPAAWTLGLGALLCLALLAVLVRADEPSPMAAAPIPIPLMVLLAAPLDVAARAFTIPLAAAAGAYVGTGRREWAALALPWARWGFVAAWSSVALTSFANRREDGTFWSWLPSEIADLLPVLALVVVLHSLIYHRKRGTFGRLGPLAAFAALLLPWMPMAPARGWVPPAWSGSDTAVAAAGVLAAGVAWATIRALRPERGGPDGERWNAPWADRLTLHNMVFVGMALIAAAGAALLASEVVDPDRAKQAMLDDAAVVLAVPFLALLGFGLGSKALGLTRAAAAVGVAVAAGAALAYADPSHWRILLALPIGFFALVGAFIKLFKVADPGPSTSMDLRVGGGLLLAGSIAAITWWADPTLPALSPVPGIPLAGIALGFAGLAGAVSCLRRDHWLLALSGSLALILSLALPALLLGILALAIIARRRALFAHGGKSWDMAGLRGRLERDLRKTGVYAVHVGIVLGLAGYAAVHFAGAPIGSENLAWGGSIMIGGGALGAILFGGARFELGGPKKD